MPASNTLKAADKQKIAKKLVTELKKHYKSSVPNDNRTVFETLVFSACLEDADHHQAEEAYARMLDAFFDLNEIRVSSVLEIEQALGEINDANWKGLRVREVLQFVFEKYYAFDFEVLKRKTQDSAIKELMSIPHISTFMRDYTLQNALGAHVIPVDERMCRALKWLGLAEATDTEEKAAEAIKSGLKKNEGQLFCRLLKQVSNEEKLQPAFEDYEDIGDVDPMEAAKRLAALIKNPVKKKTTKKKATKVSKKKPAKKKTSPRKTASAAKKAAKKTAKKTSVKKAVTKKAAKKTTTKRKKTTAKKKTAPKKKTKSKK